MKENELNRLLDHQKCNLPLSNIAYSNVVYFYHCVLLTLCVSDNCVFIGHGT